MSVETGLYSHLVADSDIAALVLNRVYPFRVPQGATLPALTYQRVSTDRRPSLSGPSTSRVKAYFQIDCYSESVSDVRDLATKVRLALDGFKGTLGSETGVGGIICESEREDDNEQTDVFRKILEFSIPHQETIT